MLKVTDSIKGDIDVEMVLSEKEQGVLASIARSEAFDILQRLLEDQVRRFNTRLMNTDVADTQGILGNFYRAKGVTQFYVGFVTRLREILQIEQFNNSGIGTPDNPENNIAIEELA